MHFYSLSRAWLLTVCGTFALLAASCAGKNLHPDLKADPKVMVRDWTLRTAPALNEAGVRGTEYSNPILLEDSLIFGTQNVGLIALYPKLNQQRWVLQIRGGVISELTTDGTSVYFGGGDGFLYSVSVDSGRVNWRYEIRNPMISAPSLSGGRLFVTTTDDTVYAFDAGTGKWLWHYRRRSSQAATILGASSPLVDGQEVIVGLSDGFLVSLNLSDGQLKWERKLHQGTKFTDVDAHPVLEDNVLYVPSYDGSLYALKRQNGEVLWRFDAGGAKRVLIEENKLYFPSSDGSIYALDKQSGKTLWHFEMDGGAPTQMISTDRYLVVGSSFQYLYVLDKATGKGLYRFNAGNGSGFSGSPAYDPNTRRVYFLSDAGNLYAFRIRKPSAKIRSHGAIDPYTFYTNSIFKEGL